MAPTSPGNSRATFSANTGPLSIRNCASCLPLRPLIEYFGKVPQSDPRERSFAWNDGRLRKEKIPPTIFWEVVVLGSARATGPKPVAPPENHAALVRRFRIARLLPAADPGSEPKRPPDTYARSNCPAATAEPFRIPQSHPVISLVSASALCPD